MTRPARTAKTYTAPKLIKYGDMVKLTASGTGTQQENFGNQSVTRFP